MNVDMSGLFKTSSISSAFTDQLLQAEKLDHLIFPTSTLPTYKHPSTKTAMMHTAALAVATFSAAAAAASAQISVVSDCGQDLYIWTASTTEVPEAQGKVPSSEEEPFTVEAEGEGVQELKITTGDDLTVPGAQLTLAYGVVDGKLKYDVYTLFEAADVPATLFVYPEEGDEEGDCAPIEVNEFGEVVTAGNNTCFEDAMLTLSLCGAAEPDETPEGEETEEETTEDETTEEE